jgi:hypothetical protein
VMNNARADVRAALCATIQLRNAITAPSFS